MGTPLVSGSARRFALLTAVVLASVVGLVGGAGGVARAAVPDPAPPLTAAQIEQLRAVTSWDFETTSTKAVVYNGSGGEYQASSGYTVSTWDYTSDLSWTVHARGTVSGPAGCELFPRTPYPCGLDYQHSGSFTQVYHRGFLGHVAYANLRCPDGNPISDGLVSNDVTFDGGYVADGSPDRSTQGGFAIDYSANPPRAFANLGYTGVHGVEVETGGSCGSFPTQRFDLGAGSTSIGLSLGFGDPASESTFGDTQVRIDSDGSFVITGIHDSSVPINTCYTPVPPAFGVNPCQITGSSTMTDAEHDVWTLRPHVDHGSLSLGPVKVEQQNYPNRGWESVPSSGAVDGNKLRLTVTVINGDSVAHDVTVGFTDAERGGILVPQLTGPAPTTVPAGGSVDLVYDWDTSGLAWDAGSSVLDPLHRLQLALNSTDSSIVVDTASKNVTIVPRPIVFVHGLFSSAGTWASLKSYVASSYPAWETFAVDTMNTGGEHPLAPTNTLVQNAQLLASYVQAVRTQTQAQHVDLVVHSMGGLISRQYIQEDMPSDALDGKPVVAHLVMLGTPNMGSPCATLLPVPFPAAFQNTPAQVLAFDGLVTNQRGVAFSILAGTPLPFTCFPLSTGPGDGAVEVTSALYIYAGDSKIDSLLHTSMTSSVGEFEAWVKPHLIDAAAGTAAAPHTLSLTRSAAPLAVTGTTGPAPEILELQNVSVPAAGNTDVSIPVSHPAQFGVLFVAPGSVSAQLIDPAGTVVDSSPKVASGDTPPFRQLGPVASAAAGTWTLHLAQEGPDPVTVVVSAWELGDPLSLQLETLETSSAGRVAISGSLTNGGSPVTGATVTATLRGVNGETRTLTLTDPGGTGTYGATSNVLPLDSYQVLLEAHAPGFSRTVVGSVDVTTVDDVAPTTSAAVSPGANGAGWNKANVTVKLSADDESGGSGVKEIDYSATGVQPFPLVKAAGATAQVTISTEGTTTLSYFAVDNAGNAEAARTLTIKLDKTPPTVTHTGNLSTYTVDQQVNITCVADDAGGSGIASTTCANLVGPATGFGLGTHTFNATATDKAGNTGSGSVSFTVTVAPASLCNLTLQYTHLSARYQGLSTRQKAAFDKTVNALCEVTLTPIEPGINPAKKKLLIAGYKLGVNLFAAGGWLTKAQASGLFRLADTL